MVLSERHKALIIWQMLLQNLIEEKEVEESEGGRLAPNVIIKDILNCSNLMHKNGWQEKLQFMYTWNPSKFLTIGSEDDTWMTHLNQLHCRKVGKCFLAASFSLLSILSSFFFPLTYCIPFASSMTFFKDEFPKKASKFHNFPNSILSLKIFHKASFFQNNYPVLVGRLLPPNPRLRRCPADCPPPLDLPNSGGTVDPQHPAGPATEQPSQHWTSDGATSDNGEGQGSDGGRIAS